MLIKNKVQSTKGGKFVRLKQRIALLLVCVMMVGTIGMMNPTQVQAETPTPPTNDYTLTVPAETTLAYDGSAVALTNGLKVSGGDLEDGKKVTVTATSAGDWQLSATGATTKIHYGLYATTDATETTTSWDFSKTDAAVTGTTKTIYSKIVASEYQSAEAGDYSDTITFTAALKSAATAVTYERTGKPALSSENLGTPTSWTYSGTTYQVYNEFIPSSSGTSWNDAMGFVAALNTAQFDGHGDWTLLSSKSMASAYAASGTGAMPNSSARGGVGYLWSSVELDEDSAHCLRCDNGDWSISYKSDAASFVGFVVLRGSSKITATAVTYERTGKPALSSENLGTPTSWTYSGTTYQVYNEFIPSSSGTSWNDAMGFVAALNTAQFDGHRDWTLLSSRSMASAYATSGTGAMPDSSARGGVSGLWSSVEEDEDRVYYLNCILGDWRIDFKSKAYTNVGFVVLRASSN